MIRPRHVIFILLVNLCERHAYLRKTDGARARLESADTCRTATVGYSIKKIYLDTMLDYCHVYYLYVTAIT